MTRKPKKQPTSHAAYLAERYRRKRSRGICTRCPALSGGKTLCPACRDDRYAYMRRLRAESRAAVLAVRAGQISA